MEFIRRLRKGANRRPSAAMVIAAVALLIALGTPVYAAQAIRSVFFAKRAGNAKKVDGLKASRRPRPNTLLALNSKGKFPASVGVAGPPGAPGKAGSPGAPGSALAYSTIVFEPPDEGGPAVWRIDDALSKKLDNDVNLGGAVGHTQPGVFCFHDLAFSVSNVVASPGPFVGTPFLVQARAARPGQTIGAPCPQNTTVAIYVTNITGTLEDPPDTSDTIYFALN